MENILFNWAIVATLLLTLVIIGYLSYYFVDSYPEFETNFKKGREYNEYYMRYGKKLSNLQIKLLYLFCLLLIVFMLIPVFAIIFCSIVIFGLFMMIVSILLGITITENLIMFYVSIAFIYLLYGLVFKSLFKDKVIVKEIV